jgi:hypothetical protein
MKRVFILLFSILLFLASCVPADKIVESNKAPLPANESNRRPFFIPYQVYPLPNYQLSQQNTNCEIIGNFPNSFLSTCLNDLIDNNITYKNFHFFDTKYGLWTDGADKRRYLYIPPNTQINTADPDNWVFPVGTILVKEFAYNGVKVETRVIEKMSSTNGDWRNVVYIWNAQQDDAVANFNGQTNVLGTGHDVPSGQTCINCHAGREDYAMGPEGLQLEHRNLEGLNLDKLELLNLITHKLPRPMIIKGTKKAQKALGYLHGNCSHCHNGNGQWPATVLGDPSILDFKHDSHATGIESEMAYISLFQNLKINLLIPEESNIIQRMNSSAFRMPPVGVKQTDNKGVQEVLDWIYEVSE